MSSYINFNETPYDITVDNMKIQVEQLNRGVFFDHCSRHRHGIIYYEIHLVTGGSGTLILDNGQYSLKSGNLYMTGPNIAHAQLTDKNNHMEEYCLGLNIHIVADSYNSPLSKIFADTDFWFGTDRNDKILRLFQKIENEFNDKTIGWVNSIKNSITDIIVELVRRYTNDISEEPVPKIGLDSKRMYIIDNSFLSEYASITESRLAEKLGLGRRQVQRFLKEHYGKTFSQMKKEARSAKARELAEKGYTAEKIAEKVGYNDTKSVIEALRKH